MACKPALAAFCLTVLASATICPLDYGLKHTGHVAFHSRITALTVRLALRALPQTFVWFQFTCDHPH